MPAIGPSPCAPCSWNSAASPAMRPSISCTRRPSSSRSASEPGGAFAQRPEHGSHRCDLRYASYGRWACRQPAFHRPAGHARREGGRDLHAIRSGPRPGPHRAGSPGGTPAGASRDGGGHPPACGDRRRGAAPGAIFVGQISPRPDGLQLQSHISRRDCKSAGLQSTGL